MIVNTAFALDTIAVEKEATLVAGTPYRVWVFLSSRCPCSNSHIDKIRAAAREFDGKEFEFVGVNSNQDETAAESESYFAKQRLGFRVERDEGVKIADRLGALKTPHVFIESAEGKILYQGGVDDSRDAHSTGVNYLREALDEIHRSVPVSHPRTRALGCVISRRRP